MESSSIERVFTVTGTLKEMGFSGMEFRWKQELSADHQRLYLHCACGTTFLSVPSEDQPVWKWDYVGSFQIYGLEVSGKCRKCRQTISLTEWDTATIFMNPEYTAAKEWSLTSFGVRVRAAMQALAEASGGALTFRQYCQRAKGNVSKRALCLFILGQVFSITDKVSQTYKQEGKKTPPAWTTWLTSELYAFFCREGLTPNQSKIEAFEKNFLASAASNSPMCEAFPLVFSAICKEFEEIRQNLRKKA